MITHTVELLKDTKQYDKVKIVTFKDSGKYYDTFYLKVVVVDQEWDDWYQIINAIKNFKDSGHLQSEFTWVIESCKTRNDSYPAMLR